MQQIIADKNIVVMLDALDELKQELRADCLQAIEVFHKSCVGMVLSCRIDEYEALPKPLPSRGTIKLQPLTNYKDRQLSDHYQARLQRITNIIARGITTRATGDAIISKYGNANLSRILQSNRALGDE